MIKRLVILVMLAGPLQAQDVALTPPPGWRDKAPLGWGDGIPCTIAPLRTVELAAPMMGVIDKVLVTAGQAVKTGDVIAEFDQAAARSEFAMADFKAKSTTALDIAQSRLDGANRRLQRLTLAQSSRAVPAADLENAQLDVAVAQGEARREAEAIDLAKLEAERAQVILDKTVVISPVTGSIGETLIDPGESPGQEPIATIYVTDPLKIEAYVPTNAIADFLAQGDYAAQIAGKTYPVILDHRANVADLSSNTLSVFFRISAPDVLPGYDCKIVAQTQPKELP